MNPTMERRIGLESSASTEMTREDTSHVPSAGSVEKRAIPEPSVDCVNSDVNLDDFDWSSFEVNFLDTAPWNMTLAPMPFTRSLVQRYQENPAMQRVANLLLYTFRSYLVGMMQHGNLPAFVHPSLQPAVEMREPLANCISLIAMISSARGSRKLFWKNVAFECERMRVDLQAADAETSLAAAQALAIYIFVRLDEGETEHNAAVEGLLVDGVAAMCERFRLVDHARKERRLQGPGYIDRLCWHEWVMEESRRRLGTVYRIINMLVHFMPAGFCTLPMDLMLAPLPARRQLWEAPENRSWEAETKTAMGHGHAYAMATNGDLVKLSDDSILLDHTDLIDQCEALGGKTYPRGAATWDEWLANTDAFGGLIMLAASMVQ
ncbi:unnamed protein product [Zymoseptoria tritici ST99CH_3D1]|nr:unnamed protein product [Zymoseptoria tritici ST99CH_3D1]